MLLAATGLAACRAADPPEGDTHSTAPDASTTPSVAPGEAWIAYQRAAPDGSDGIFLVRPDGTDDHQLAVDLPGEESHPDWSPDGDRLAFIHGTSSGRTELWVVGASGDGAQMLRRCDLPCNEWSYPDWSPEGDAIFLGTSADPTAGGPPETFGVARFDLESGRLAPVLTRHGDVTAEQPRVSPDGSHTGYTRLRERPGRPLEGAIFVADTRGGPERRLTDWSMVAMHPDWTPDGRIVFDTYDIMLFRAQDPPRPGNLWIMDADGSHLTQLTRFTDVGTQASQPRVAPDGSGVSFTRDDGFQRRMAFLPLDGGVPTWLTDPPMNGTHAELRPS